MRRVLLGSSTETRTRSSSPDRRAPSDALDDASDCAAGSPPPNGVAAPAGDPGVADGEPLLLAPACVDCTGVDCTAACWKRGATLRPPCGASRGDDENMDSMISTSSPAG